MSISPGRHVIANQDAGPALDVQGCIARDAFLGEAVIARQPAAGYRAGLDAVLLAASAEGGPEADLRVLDLGAGVGVVGLCVAARLPAASLTLLEREPVLAALARSNVSDNGFDQRMTVVEADLRAPAAEIPVAAESFDHVLANPPYFDPRAMRLPRDRLRAAAHAMPAEALEHWLRAMARFTRPGGRISLIHKADALAELLAVIGNRFGSVEIRPVQPREQRPAHRVLIRATKGSRAPLRILPPLILHDETNAFRDEVAQVLRGPVGLADIS